jgi:hypothetical protein
MLHGHQERAATSLRSSSVYECPRLEKVRFDEHYLGVDVRPKVLSGCQGSAPLAGDRAGAVGIEPTFAGPEPAGLPLTYAPILHQTHLPPVALLLVSTCLVSFVGSSRIELDPAG